MRKIALRHNVKEYNEYYNEEKTFVENLHDFLKSNKFVNDKHYIEIDCGDYIAFCPFIYEILGSFRGFFRHCVANQKIYFDRYFELEFYGRHNLKVFFIKKDSFFKKDDKYREFTCWLDTNSVPRFSFNKKRKKIKEPNRLFYLFHDSNNDCSNPETLNYAKPIIEKNYDKIMDAFINSKIYSKLIED